MRNTMLVLTSVLAVLSGILLCVDVPARVCLPECYSTVTRVLALFHVANDIAIIVLFCLKGEYHA